MIELWDGDVDCVVFLQTIEHVQDPDAVLARIRDARRPRRRRLRLDPERAHARARGRGALGQPVAHQGVPRRGVPRAVRAPLRLGRAARAVPRAQAARPPGRDRAPGVGLDPRRAADHQAVLRPLHARHLGARLRAALRAASTARWTSSRSCGRERPPQHRPAHPHALRGGLRDVAVRRGVAVGGDGDLLPAAGSTCSTPTPGASRSRSPRCCATSSRPTASASASSPSCARSGRRRTGATSRRPRTPGVARELERSAGLYARGGRALRGARGRPRRRRSRRTWPGPRRPPTPCCRCWPPPPACGSSSASGSPRTASASGTGTAASGCRSAGTRRGSTRCSRRPACTRSCVDLTDVLGYGSPAQLRPLRSDAGPLLVPIDRALMDLVWHNERLPVGRRLPQHAPPHRAPPHAVGGRRRALRPGARRRAGSRARARLRRGGGAAAGGRRARGLRARHRAARALLARGGRLAGGDDRGVRRWRASSWSPLDAALAGVEPRRPPEPSCPTRAGASRATSPPGARRRRPSSRGGRATAELRVLGAGRPSRRARAARAAGPPGLRLGLRRHPRDGRPVLARAGRRRTPPSSSARSPIRPESVPLCATLHLLSTCLTLDFRVSEFGEIWPHSAELCAYTSRLLELNTGRVPARTGGRERGTHWRFGARGESPAERRRSAGLSASPTANPVGTETQEVAVPFIDPANPSPWLASLSASRRRRAEAARAGPAQARRPRRRRGAARGHDPRRRRCGRR